MIILYFDIDIYFNQVIFTVVQFILCRCYGTDYLLHISVPICFTTLRHPSNWVLLCANSPYLVVMHKCARPV